AYRGVEGESAPAGLPALEKAWQQLTSAQRQEPALILAYAEQLRRHGADVQAEEVLRTAMKREYNAHLARLYGLLGETDRSNQLFQEGLGLLDERLLARPLPALARA
nr:hypothetical protein [Tanacetum cinerariifolium]